MDQSPIRAWLPDLIYTGDGFAGELALHCDDAGQIAGIEKSRADSVSRKNQALLPGLVNTHSHAFQRVIRGRTEYRTKPATDSFWTWREMMYSAASRLSPED